MAHVCPSWIGYFLLNPMRRVVQNPRRLLGPLTSRGDTVLEIGPGMGFFTLDLARLVGPEGRVVAIDIQPRMLKVLRRRLERAGLAGRVDMRLVPPDRLAVDDLAGAVDLALAIFVVHEIDDKASLFAQLRRTLKPGGRLLFAEPPLHVSRAMFERSIEIASGAGLRLLDRPPWPRCRAALLT